MNNVLSLTRARQLKLAREYERACREWESQRKANGGAK